MKKFISKVLIFFIPAILYSFISMIYMPYFLSRQNGPTTKQQITYSFDNAISKDYELLILGNSRTYRGLNPDVFSFRSFNFSHDNDSFNQIYYKLVALLENQKTIKYLVLGLDYFQFSFKSGTRNYVYADLLGDKYMSDFDDNILRKKMEYYLGNINPKKLLALYPKGFKPFLRENGQYIRPGFAKESDSITRDINRLDFQVSYFKKTIDFCISKNIKVFIVMLPTRSNELNSYSNVEKYEFNRFIEKHTDNSNIFYLNYSTLDGFDTKDYTDITHFNEPAANRFSSILDADILRIVNDEQDTNVRQSATLDGVSATLQSRR